MLELTLWFYQDISLVVRANNEVIFVYWDSVARRKGRHIALDEWGRIITIVFFRVEQICLLDAEIRIPRAGTYFKSSPAYRPHMPVWAVRARFLESTRFFPDPSIGARSPQETKLALYAKQPKLAMWTRAEGYM